LHSWFGLAHISICHVPVNASFHVKAFIVHGGTKTKDSQAQIGRSNQKKQERQERTLKGMGEEEREQIPTSACSGPP
jgi:hypothetical protein